MSVKRCVVAVLFTAMPEDIRRERERLIELMKRGNSITLVVVDYRDFLYQLDEGATEGEALAVATKRGPVLTFGDLNTVSAIMVDPRVMAFSPTTREFMALWEDLHSIREAMARYFADGNTAIEAA